MDILIILCEYRFRLKGNENVIAEPFQLLRRKILKDRGTRTEFLNSYRVHKKNDNKAHHILANESLLKRKEDFVSFGFPVSISFFVSLQPLQ